MGPREVTKNMYYAMKLHNTTHNAQFNLSLNFLLAFHHTRSNNKTELSANGCF